MKHEVIADPERVEAVTLGEPRSVDEQVLIRLEPEMRNEQTETRHRRLLLLDRCPRDGLSQGHPAELSLVLRG
jgi:hypothetical protein